MSNNVYFDYKCAYTILAIQFPNTPECDGFLNDL